jgi:hypothetical protein
LLPPPQRLLLLLRCHDLRLLLLLLFFLLFNLQCPTTLPADKVASPLLPLHVIFAVVAAIVVIVVSFGPSHCIVVLALAADEVATAMSFVEVKGTDCTNPT